MFVLVTSTTGRGTASAVPKNILKNVRALAPEVFRFQRGFPAARQSSPGSLRHEGTRALPVKGGGQNSVLWRLPFLVLYPKAKLHAIISDGKGTTSVVPI
jgi:hypothetical protein